MKKVYLFFLMCAITTVGFSQNSPDVNADGIINSADVVSVYNAIIYGWDDSQNDKSKISVTGSASNIDYNSVTLSAWANISNTNVTDLEVGIIYSLNEIPNANSGTKEVVGLSNISKNSKYSVNLTGLKSETTYYYRSYVYQNGIYFYGKVMNFSTQADFVLTTGTIDNEKNTITSTFDIASGSFNIIEIGICFSELNSNPTIADECITANEINDNCFTVAVPEGLNYYRAYIIADGIVHYGDVLEKEKPVVEGISGEWEGDWGMWYQDSYGSKNYATYTYIKLIPYDSYATRGYGYQEDFYNTGAYRYLWYKFDWSVKDGIIYITYRFDSELDTFIRDYKISNNYFSGYFGVSNSFFRMSKLSDWYNWTPDIYVVSDCYGYSLWSSYSKQYELGAGAKAYNEGLPQIVKRGSHFLKTEDK